jgi:hypothetical protein
VSWLSFESESWLAFDFEEDEEDEEDETMKMRRKAMMSNCQY